MRLKQVYLEEAQVELLRRLAEKTGVSESALIRACIDLYARTAWALERRPAARRPNPWEEELEAARAFREAHGSAPREWRREDLYGRGGRPL